MNLSLLNLSLYNSHFNFICACAERTAFTRKVSLWKFNNLNNVLCWHCRLSSTAIIFVQLINERTYWNLLTLVALCKRQNHYSFKMLQSLNSSKSDIFCAFVSRYGVRRVKLMHISSECNGFFGKKCRWSRAACVLFFFCPFNHPSLKLRKGSHY